MRNKTTPAEAITIGVRAKTARLRLNQTLQEVGLATGLHHSQVSRFERGAFRVISKNVQVLCRYLEVAHPKLPKAEPARRELRQRFDALIEDLPESAVVFARLFDLIEATRHAKSTRRRTRKI